MLVKGIHHITAIASEPQKTVDFYTKVLGLRLVKKSVNQDDTKTYHFFFGDRIGEAGMDLTFFTFQPVMQGSRGVGQVTTTSLAVREQSLGFWKKRFEKLLVVHDEVTESFGKKRLVFYDHDSQKLELVGVKESELDSSNVWTTKEIDQEKAVNSFYSARLTVEAIHELPLQQILLQALDYEIVDKKAGLVLYHAIGQDRAAFLEVEVDPSIDYGINAAGTVHHIAFKVENDDEQLQVREKILKMGLYPTPVIDRFYFKSVYFRTPAGILFELATAGPGFTSDEDEKHLGEKLALPPFLESQRKEIEKGLTPITVER